MASAVPIADDAGDAGGATAPPLSVPSLRAQLRAGRAALFEPFLKARPTAPAAARLIRSLTAHVDQTLIRLWEHAIMPRGASLWRS